MRSKLTITRRCEPDQQGRPTIVHECVKKTQAANILALHLGVIVIANGCMLTPDQADRLAAEIRRAADYSRRLATGQADQVIAEVNQETNDPSARPGPIKAV